MKSDWDGLDAGDVFTTEDGRELLVQYTVETDDGLAIYGRWIAEDGSIDALASHLVTARGGLGVYGSTEGES